MTGLDASGDPALEPLLRIEEVARLLRISERGVYRLMRRGELTALKVGHRTLVESQEVADHIRKLGCDPLPMSVKAFEDMVAKELKENAELIKKANIKAG